LVIKSPSRVLLGGKVGIATLNRQAAHRPIFGMSNDERQFQTRRTCIGHLDVLSLAASILATLAMPSVLRI